VVQLSQARPKEHRMKAMSINQLAPLNGDSGEGIKSTKKMRNKTAAIASPVKHNAFGIGSILGAGKAGLVFIRPPSY
jgi:hypothetical protein